jgi:transposase-like protein
MKICPSCSGSKIRNGYLKAPLILRLLCIREFLCESCNFTFRAFALYPAKSRGVRMRHKAARFNQAPAVDLSLLNEPSHKVRAALQPALSLEQTATISSAQTEINEMGKRLSARPLPHPAAAGAGKRHLTSHPTRACPHCGSHDARRRHRKAWERLLLGFTEIRAYTCQSCSASFYARREISPSE